jgi:Mlc titration factor MtfA (ptsG expression regulator)
MTWIAIVVGFCLAAVWWGARSRERKARRERLLRTMLPENVTEVLRRTVPVYARLDPALRRRVDGKINVFLATKSIVGCKDVVVLDELRWTIAGHACLMLAGRDDDWVYDDLSEVLVHPLTWRREDSISLGDGLEIREPWAAFDGESWSNGPVILSRGAIRKGSRDLDGYNVVFHEFAHQLDAENGAMEGCPAFPNSLKVDWARVMDFEYKRLVKADENGIDTFIDPYGAEHPSEFFAVATEAFLEIPQELRAEHPELYAVMVRAFGFDPETGLAAERS